MKKKTTYSLGIVLLAAVLGVLVGLLFAPQSATDKESMDSFVDGGTLRTTNRIKTLMTLIDNAYVDEVDPDSLSTIALQAMLSSLDPHSAYFPPHEFDKEEEVLRGSFEGIGVVLRYLHDTVYAFNVQEGTPAARAGVHSGDRIIWVDTTRVSGSGMTQKGTDIVNLIRGPIGSTVSLGIQRQGSENVQYIKVSRRTIRRNSIPAAVMLDSHTGYIHISTFASTTADEFHNALLQLKSDGMDRLLLDLRGNTGGSLEAAIGVTRELLPKGDLIVYTEGAHVKRHNVYATRGGLFAEGDLTVLINEYSASASEIVAGAVQDNDRGLIVGRRSFGKGLVQRQFDLSDEGSILLTVARYYTPSGRCIQRPYDKGSDAYYMEYLDRLLSAGTEADSLLSATDTSQQFLTKQGRKVYGGGGILPDKTLPYLIDTNWVYFNRLLSNQVLDEVLLDQLFNHYDALIARYPTADKFVRLYQVDNDTWQRILATADSKGIRRHQGCLHKYGNYIRNRYKAMMAEALFDDNAYYRVALDYDTELQKARNIK